MERKIGEIFEYNGEWYQVVECDSCGECSLRATECGSGTKSDLADEVFGECSKVRRSDSRHTIFKKLEKVGEPTRIAGRDVQLLRTIIKSCNGCIFYKDPHCLNPTNGRMDCGNMEDGIYIEIKQNKENMEEKSLNLKPFDLEKAKQGKPVCTRDGRKARIICFDVNCSNNQPIIALITEENGFESLYSFTSEGKWVKEDSVHDLMMLPEKKEGWVVVSRNEGGYTFVDNNIFDNEESADRFNLSGVKKIAVIKIEWRE